MDLVAITAALGQLSWVSSQLAQLEKNWSAPGLAPFGEDVPVAQDPAPLEPAATVHLATHARHHAWHAELFNDALPDSPSLDAGAHVAGSTSWQLAFQTANDLDSTDAVGVLVGLYRHLVPAHAAATSALMAKLTSPGDDAIARILWFALSDQQSDLLGGSGLLLAALSDAITVERANSVGRLFDTAFVAG